MPTLNPEQCQRAWIEPASPRAGRSRFDRVGAFRSERVLGSFDRRIPSILIFPLLARRRSNTVKDRRQKRDSLLHNLVFEKHLGVSVAPIYFLRRDEARRNVKEACERREKDREAYRLNGNFEEFGQCVGVHNRIPDDGWYDDNEIT